MSDKDYKKNKKADELKSKYDVFNPIVNVNVNCCDNKKESARPSAFRTDNRTTAQSVGPADFTLIDYPNEIYDLNDEYDDNPNSPTFSTFIPKQDGIYLIIASIGFVPDVSTNYSCRMFITINEEDAAAADNDFFGADVPVTNLVSVSTVTKLSKGDRVRIIAQATTNGNTVPDPIFTHFEAIRFPL